MPLTKTKLNSALQKLGSAKPKITVIGDLILDEYLIGYPERISREAPVLILEYKENYYRLGGAANAAINAAHLGADVTLIGTVGEDNAAKEMDAICKQNNIRLLPLRLQNKPTTLKTRILSTNLSSSLEHNGNGFSQQVLRIDRQSKRDLSAEENKDLLALIKTEIKNSDVTLLSDYCLGVLSQEISQAVIKENNKVIVDPSGGFSRFAGSYLITPNEPDTEKELGQSLDFHSSQGISQIKDSLQRIFQDKTSFLITRGSEGMILIEDKQINEVPAFNKAEVFDVTGAGDTVSACVSVAIAAGLSLQEAMSLGNLAASIVVRKSGSATTNYKEMKEALDKLEIQ
jgi:rfaE bifunctional protein kinase chain/domain